MYFGCYLFCYAFTGPKKRRERTVNGQNEYSEKKSEKQQWQQKGTWVFGGPVNACIQSGGKRRNTRSMYWRIEQNIFIALLFCVFSTQRSIYFQFELLFSYANGICRHETINVNRYIIERFYVDFSFLVVQFRLLFFLCFLFLIFCAFLLFRTLKCGELKQNLLKSWSHEFSWIFKIILWEMLLEMSRISQQFWRK